MNIIQAVLIAYLSQGGVTVLDTYYGRSGLNECLTAAVKAQLPSAPYVVCLQTRGFVE